MKGHIIFNGRYTSKGAVRFVEKDIWKGKGLDLQAYWNVDELNAPRMAIFNFQFYSDVNINLVRELSQNSAVSMGNTFNANPQQWKWALFNDVRSFGNRS